MKKVRLLIYNGEESWINETLAHSIPPNAPKIIIPGDNDWPPCTITAITDLTKIMEALKDLDLT